MVSNNVFKNAKVCKCFGKTKKSQIIHIKKKHTSESELDKVSDVSFQEFLRIS